MGITGIRPGRMFVDTTIRTAVELATRLFAKQKSQLPGETAEESASMVMTEFANIICGLSVSKINNSFAVQLRPTPASVLIGNKLKIMNPKLQVFVMTAHTALGPINLSIGFAGGK